jgi:hypothetical protein
MPRYARIATDQVAEIISLPEDLTPAEVFHPDFAKAVVNCPDTAVVEGWGYDGAKFTAPTALPAIVPASVSSAQAKIQLRRAGLRDKVDAAVKAAGGEVLDWFTDARVWERDNPHVSEIGSGLNLKDSDIDELFVEASKIAA